MGQMSRENVPCVRHLTHDQVSVKVDEELLDSRHFNGLWCYRFERHSALLPHAGPTILWHVSANYVHLDHGEEARLGSERPQMKLTVWC